MTGTVVGDDQKVEESAQEIAIERMQCMDVCGGSHSTIRAIELGGLQCWIESKPHGNAAAGGDIYYASNCATGRIGRLLLADVSGHGSAVADIADGLRLLMRRFVNRLDHDEFVTLLNRKFAESSPDDIFATAIVATFFAPSRRLRLCNAGHPRPLFYEAARGEWRLMGNDYTVHSANLPLGILDQCCYQHFDIELQSGDCLLAYTDALSESFDADGEMFGEEGLLRVVRRMGPGVRPQNLIATLKREIVGANAGNLCNDDQTFLLIRATGGELRHSTREKAGAGWRFLKTLVGSFGRTAERAPFPEFSLPNVGGAVFPWLARRWRAPVAKG